MDVIKQSFKYYKKIMLQEIIILLLSLLSILVSLILPQFSALIIDKILYPALNPEMADKVNVGEGMFDFLIAGFPAEAYMDKLLVVLAVFGACLLAFVVRKPLYKMESFAQSARPCDGCNKKRCVQQVS